MADLLGPELGGAQKRDAALRFAAAVRRASAGNAASAGSNATAVLAGWDGRARGAFIIADALRPFATASYRKYFIYEQRNG